MDTRKEGLKDLCKALIAVIIILAITKILSNTVLTRFSDEVYKTFYSKVIMTVLVLIAVIVLRKMKIHLFSFRLMFAGFLGGVSVGEAITSTALSVDNMLQMIPGLALLYLLPALIVLRPKKVNPLLGKVVI